MMVCQLDACVGNFTFIFHVVLCSYYCYRAVFALQFNLEASFSASQRVTSPFVHKLVIIGCA